MSADLPIYPRGAIAMDNGDLADITNVKVEQPRAGTKIIHTMKTQGAGVVLGNEETTVSFDAVCSENGPERDYFSMLRRGLVKKIRIKIPGETFTVIGVASKRSLELQLDDAVKYSLEFMGKTVT